MPFAAVSTPNLAVAVTSDSSGNPATKGSRKALTYARNAGYRSKLCGPEVSLVVHIELLVKSLFLSAVVADAARSANEVVIRDG